MSLNVLIINQSEDLCSTLCSFLRSEGHLAKCNSEVKRSGCSSVHSGTSLFNEAVEDLPNLIILEVDMPETDSIELVKRLHRSSTTKNIPLIVISDFPELEFEFLNIFDFICKPIDLGRLRENIGILLSGARTRDAAIKLLPLTPDEHLKFHDFLIQHCGLHFERRNIKVLERGLMSRMTALHIDSFSNYFEYLCKNMEHRQELQKLLQHLTVGETFFFRYHAHFEALGSTVLPNLLGAGQHKKLRIWSAGCSTGEEPYSIAMAIMENIPDWKKLDIKIIATDINTRSLRRAREGVYNAWKVRVTDKHYLDRYFKRIGESYVVRDEVKKLVEFSYLNLQSPPQPNSENFDIIFCRNVMIYFTTDTTKKIVETFANSLKPGGYLFLGHSETLSQISSRFERHMHDGGFYYNVKGEHAGKTAATTAAPVIGATVTPSRKATPPLTAPVVMARDNNQPTPARQAHVQPFRTAPAVTVQEDPDMLFVQAETLILQENFSEASDVLEKTLQKKPDHAGAILCLGQIHLMCGRMNEALNCFNRALALDDLLPEGYFLRGLLYEMEEKSVDAFQEYRKAVLLKMDFVMPHYQLGKLYFRSDDVKAAMRELKNSMKLLEKAAREALIPFSGGLSREVFLEQLRSEINMIETALSH